MIVALSGQPNSGKSTLFNALSGFKAETANFPGQTVAYQRSSFLMDGEVVEVFDLPGTYSLTSTDPAGREARAFLLRGDVDVVVDVLDASTLSRSLELTLQLMEMSIPLVVCLNMMDDARRKGNRIDVAALEARLGVPVVGMVANAGEGLMEFLAALRRQSAERRRGIPPRYADDVEQVVGRVSAAVDPSAFQPAGLSPRFIALKLLEEDADFTFQAAVMPEGIRRPVADGRESLARGHGRPADVVISSERHSLAMNLFEEVATVGPPPPRRFADRLDSLLLHPLWGFIALAVIFYGIFWSVFSVGGLVEAPILRFFEDLSTRAGALVTPPLLHAVVAGVISGIASGTAIVLPYLVPFFIFLSILEDTGYIPRMAFLTDSVMHRMGLHGKSAFPLILGYGCSVPAVMATRMLESTRDRFVTSALAVMVPCSARISIIFGLVAAFLAPSLALGVFLANLVVLAALGKIMTSRFAGEAPGMIMEIPPYRLPNLRILGMKTWVRLREFILIAWPILIAGSIIVGFMEHLGLVRWVNMASRPLTWLLGLPEALGVPLVFGVLRKELSLLMLFQALGTVDVLSVLTPTQVITFTMFVIFYVPCLSTISVLVRDQGAIATAKIVLLTMAVAVTVGLAVRAVGAVLTL